MGMELEDLRMLQNAEAIADRVWQQISRWPTFSREVVGGQLARAADSVGANMAEAFGRYHYGEKLRFLYYARGSLYETKYWLNRANARNLLSSQEVDEHISQLSGLARQLNAFAKHLKSRRSKQSAEIKETSATYHLESDEDENLLINEDDLTWLSSTNTLSNKPN